MKMYFDGQWIDHPRQMPVFDPQDGTQVDTVPMATAADMERAISAAVAGAERARCMPVHQRIALLNGAAVWIEEHQETYAHIIAREGIKTIREARKEASALHRHAAHQRRGGAARHRRNDPLRPAPRQRAPVRLLRARAAGRCRRDHAVQRPAQSGGAQGRSGHRRRQRDHRQAAQRDSPRAR